MMYLNLDIVSHMKDNDWKKRLGVVFSTATDYDYQTDAEEEVKTLEAKEQKLRVRIEKNGRGGKTVTIISGFIGSETDLKELGKALKSKCGVGGSAKDGEVLVQGDFKQRVIEILRAMGYTQTK
jgi:hypothetical protein